MSKLSIAVVVVAVGVPLSGCSAITGPTPDDSAQHRLVVESGYAEEKNVTVVVEPTKSGPVINETRRLAPDEQWVVTTLNEPTTVDGYTVHVSTEEGSMRHEVNGGETGAIRYVIGGGLVESCHGNLTCYKETA